MTITEFMDENCIDKKEIMGSILRFCNDKISEYAHTSGGWTRIEEKKWKDYKKIVKAMFEFADLNSISI